MEENNIESIEHINVYENGKNYCEKHQNMTKTFSKCVKTLVHIFINFENA